ncbi:MAG: hypothetical protein E6Y75_06635, partial [Anaerococcus sp.]|nr:hypothetical protein [Anaerococcus sp.]
MDDFDFNEKGNQKLLGEDKLVFNLEFLQYESLDPDFNLYEKDKDGNLKIKNQGDIFALLVNDKKSLFDTKKLEEDYNNLKTYKEEKAQTEADQKAKKEAEEKAKKETEEKEKQEEAKKAQEEKAQAEKSSSNKEEKTENSKDESNKDKESKTEIKVESNETSKEEKETKTDSNKEEEKDSTKKETKTQEKAQETKKAEENKKEEKAKEKKDQTKKQGLMPKLRMLFLGQPVPAMPVGAGQGTPLTEAEKQNIANKKFHVKTIFQTSNAGGAIQPYQYFKIHLDDELKVNDPNTLKPIIYNGRVIAKPTYNKDKDDNTITYDIVGTIPENISVPLDIPVDYNPDKITLDPDGTFTVINKVSGLGIVNPPKDLVPQRMDKNGNLAGSIIEPGRHDVIQIIDDEHDRTYSVNIDAHGKPAVENGKIKGINWTVKVHSTDDLKDLGFKLNLTAVEGSGLKEIKDVKLNGEPVTLTKQLENATGIVDSKHHNLDKNTKELLYTFYTPVERVQSAYMLDVSTILRNKNNTLGAARLVLDDVYKADAISEATPTRVGMNNRTTIQGKFKSANEAEWTVTDQVSSGDEKEPNANKGLPLETRKLEGSQNFKSGKSVVYGIDTDSES